MGISICMITKNEEKCLATCLESIKGFADEIIVVDTSSKDKTKEIAKSFGAKMYDFEWVDDFSAARNFSLSKATQDWIFVIDADEVIAKKDHAKILEAVHGEFDGYLLIQRTYTNDSSSPSWVNAGGDNYREIQNYAGWVPTRLLRMFRKAPRIRYEGRVHETVLHTIENNGGVVSNLDIPIHHYGKVRGDDYTRQKGEMYLKLGEEKVSEAEDKVKSYFELGVQAARLGDQEKAVDAFQKLLEIDSTHVGAYLNLGAAYIKLKKIDTAIEVLEKGKEVQPTTALLNNLGVAYEENKEYEKAMDTYHEALRLDPANTEAYENIARIYYFLGNFEKLILVLRDIITLNPRKMETYHNLAGIYLKLEKPTKAIELLQEAAKIDDSNAQTFLNLGKALTGDAQVEEAKNAFKKASTLDNSLKESCDKMIAHIGGQYHS